MEDVETTKECSKEGRSLTQLIEEGDWSLVRLHCKAHPEDIEEEDSTSGGTVLHRICATPPVPFDIFQLVVEMYPAAVRIQERPYRMTPLHILSWRSQKTTSKVRILLEYMNPEDLQLRNSFGGTALHNACRSQASLEVLKLIVNKNPAIVMSRTYDYNHSALSALWHSHLQSIPGHMQVARLLKGEEVREGLFERFWEKVELLARQSFMESPASFEDTSLDSSDYVLHGLLQLRAPLNALRVAIKRDKKYAAVSDTDGNYPLHIVLSRRPYATKDTDLIIAEIIQAFPDAATIKNKAGDLPLFIGVREQIAWEEGLKAIVNANPSTLSSVDGQTGLYPFLLAATLGGQMAHSNSYMLLCAAPFLVKGATFLKR